VVDLTLLHVVNHSVATRDWLEDAVTGFAAVAVPIVATLTCALWLLARPYANSRWKRATATALFSAGLALLTNQAIAHLWDRPRPFAAHPADVHLLAAPSADPSFPSDHAAAAFAIAVAVLMFSRPAGAAFLALAIAVSTSRVALGLHYPSDVVAGAIVGTLSAVLVASCGRAWVIVSVTVASRITDPLLLRARRLGRR
jgi:undecaprenyl-diphosphatase